MSSSDAQTYTSTRGGSSGLSFEDVVLKGLAEDGGLFVPQSIPLLPSNWREWASLSFEDLAFEIMSLYIARSEIDSESLKEIVRKSYGTFRHKDVTPLVPLDKAKNLYLLELFHGPTFAFKDVALQFLGNLFEYFLVRRNANLQEGEKRHHLTIVGATSGDTGSAAIYGLRNKKDVSVFILFPTGRVSAVQEAQMTTVLDPNVHCLSVAGTFDDCQDMVKALFADTEIRKSQHLAAVNSINWARILAQITYYFSAYFSLVRQEGLDPNGEPPHVTFTVPTGNFGDILAGFFAKRMGLPIAKLVVATNENDILYRFWQAGKYEKKYAPPNDPSTHGGIAADGAAAHEEGVKETLSPAMDILVSSNFERLVWILLYEQQLGAPATTTATATGEGNTADAARRQASKDINSLFASLKASGSFEVSQPVLQAALGDFGAERVSDDETVATIKAIYAGNDAYILDPHSSIGVTAALRSIAKTFEDPLPQHTRRYLVSLATAHPAKFANAVDLALSGVQAYTFADIIPAEFAGLEQKERKVRLIAAQDRSLAGIRSVIVDEVRKESVAS
ncbi:threonine synthase [Pseudovirgaria hyperparasitica]|uniref:threonine synthase n=1 Tax=Pseudovirgaria hyperparasitica TaxID=470096 RepID=A0A6A6WBS3_9PEZI|nr:threonine synthase [Pseudovirgaria hyperparasitica]KAF2758561.1 threonine synthase [Pseudovirgaria hyperparasitica]